MSVVRGLPGIFCCGFGCVPCASRMKFSARRVVDAIRATIDDAAEEICELEDDEAMTLQVLGTSPQTATTPKRLRRPRCATICRNRERTCSRAIPTSLRTKRNRPRPTPNPCDGSLNARSCPGMSPGSRSLRSAVVLRTGLRRGLRSRQDKLERLGRYKVHLERTLAMLIRLQDLRRPTVRANLFRKLRPRTDRGCQGMQRNRTSIAFEVAGPPR